jgi:hypothetical protein
MADAADRRFEVVLVYHTSRFARNQVEARRYKQMLRERLEPTSWNRFGGRWGAPERTRIAKMCLKSEGPRSPSKQPRAVLPPPGVGLSFDFLDAFAGR